VKVGQEPCQKYVGNCFNDMLEYEIKNISLHCKTILSQIERKYCKELIINVYDLKNLNEPGVSFIKSFIY